MFLTDLASKTHYPWLFSELILSKYFSKMYTMTGICILAKLSVMLYILLKYFSSSTLYCTFLAKMETNIGYSNAYPLVRFSLLQLYEKYSEDDKNIKIA